jgi:hypothetical protein
MWPNLFTIGAAKSGTTSLHYYLSLHPDIHMTREKEPNYFASLVAELGSQVTRVSRDQYHAMLETDKPVRGESSVIYSFWPYPSGIPERIHEVAPDARFIYVVRDPVDRVISHYNHRVVRKTEFRSLAEVIAEPNEPNERYLTASSYATQLEQYLRLFPQDRFLVVDHTDLLRDRRAVLAEAFAFLGVDPDFHDPRFDALVNQAEDHRRFSPLGDRVRGSRVYQSATGWIRPDMRLKLLKPFRHALSDPVQRSRPTDEEREILASRLAGEAQRLRALTGRSFATWSV